MTAKIGLRFSKSPRPNVRKPRFTFLKIEDYDLCPGLMPYAVSDHNNDIKALFYSKADAQEFVRLVREQKGGAQ